MAKNKRKRKQSAAQRPPKKRRHIHLCLVCARTIEPEDKYITHRHIAYSENKAVVMAFFKTHEACASKIMLKVVEV